MVRGVKTKRRKTNGRKTRPSCIQIVFFCVLTSYSWMVNGTSQTILTPIPNSTNRVSQPTVP
jgi:hypothetical protein